jgi:uncharacterized protein
VSLVLLVLAFGVGVLIGAVGIGGILLAPILAFVGGWELHTAIGTSVWSFMFTGVAATLLYARHGTIAWPVVVWLVIGVVPAAVLGALANGLVSGTLLTLLLALGCIGTGVFALVGRRVESAAKELRPALLIGLGFVVGFGSALTGAGGAVILMPLMLALRVPTLIALGASQVMQVPVAAFATLAYAPAGRVDFLFGTLVGISEVIGVALGTRVAHAVAPGALRRGAAVAVIAAGGVLLARVVVLPSSD